MSDAHAQTWYAGPGSETDRCSGEITDYDGVMTMPAIYQQIKAEEGQAYGLFQAPATQYGTPGGRVSR